MKGLKVLQWLSQNPDVKLIEILRWDLERAVDEQMPTSLNELCKEERARITARPCEGLVMQKNNYFRLLQRLRLKAVLQAVE